MQNDKCGILHIATDFSENDGSVEHCSLQFMPELDTGRELDFVIQGYIHNVGYTYMMLTGIPDVLNAVHINRNLSDMEQCPTDLKNFISSPCNHCTKINIYFTQSHCYHKYALGRCLKFKSSHYCALGHCLIFEYESECESESECEYEYVFESCVNKEK